jgi:hypothetical protein
MKTINVLIIASSDMDGSEDGYNIPSTVIDIPFPCAKYTGKPNKVEYTDFKTTPRCNKCKYTEIEHKYKYPLKPLNPINLYRGEQFGKPFYMDCEYSDLWHSKQMLFEGVKNLFGTDININYHTCNPLYKNNLDFLPTINKINSIVSKNIGIKGKIQHTAPYNFQCDIDKIKSHPDYNNFEYDFITIVSGGLGWIYQSKNFKVVESLLPKDKTKMGIVAHFFNIPMIEKPEYSNKFKFINPINSVLANEGVNIYSKRDINDCIKNYTNILLGNKFIEMYEILFRRAKQHKRTAPKRTAPKRTAPKRTTKNTPNRKSQTTVKRV